MVLKLFMAALLATPVSALARAVDELLGSAPEARVQAAAPAPKAAAGFPAEDAFLLKTEAEHDPGACLFEIFPPETDAKNSATGKQKAIPFLEIAQREAAAQGVDLHLILAVIQKESSFDPLARSKCGAMGLMQLMPATAQWLGLKDVSKLRDPEVNIRYGTKYLKLLWKEFAAGDPSAIKQCDPENPGFAKILAAYNAGPGNVRKYNGIPPFPQTTRYVALVTEYFKAYEQLPGLPH